MAYERHPEDRFIGAPVGREPWRTDAACAGADPAVFDAGSAMDELTALVYCGNCPVIVECLAWAQVETEFTGVAGGRVWRRHHRTVL